MCTVSVRAGSVHCLSEGGECALSTVRAWIVRVRSLYCRYNIIYGESSIIKV